MYAVDAPHTDGRRRAEWVGVPGFGLLATDISRSEARRMRDFVVPNRLEVRLGESPRRISFSKSRLASDWSWNLSLMASLEGADGRAISGCTWVDAIDAFAGCIAGTYWSADGDV